ncbi:hypothetical protein Tco_0060146 [Tanacetum coccineum]
MDGTLTYFNMLVEKRYPLMKEMLQKMLDWKLEAKAESTMAFELLKFIKKKKKEEGAGHMEMEPDIENMTIKPIHTTPPNDDYVAPATKLILDELLEEFGDEILNVTMVDNEVDFYPTEDLEELERLLAKEPQSKFTEIQIRTLYLLEETLTRLHSSTWATKWFKRLVAYAKCNRDSYKIFLAAIHAMHMWWCLDTKQAARKHRKPD